MISDLNAIWYCIADLREATALLEDRVTGTNDPMYDRVKGYRETIRKAEKAYNSIMKGENDE